MLALFPAARRVEDDLGEELAGFDRRVGIFTVARPPEHDARASRLLNMPMDGLRSAP